MYDYSPFVAEDQELSKLNLCDPDFACPECGASEALQSIFSVRYNENGTALVWRKCFICETRWGKEEQ